MNYLELLQFTNYSKMLYIHLKFKEFSVRDQSVVRLCYQMLWDRAKYVFFGNFKAWILIIIDISICYKFLVMGCDFIK